MTEGESQLMKLSYSEEEQLLKGWRIRSGYSSTLLGTDLAKRKERMSSLDDLMRQMVYCFGTKLLQTAMF